MEIREVWARVGHQVHPQFCQLSHRFVSLLELPCHLATSLRHDTEFELPSRRKISKCYHSIRRTECDAEFFPRRSRAGCGRDCAATLRLLGNLSQLGTLSPGTALGFAITAGDALPGCLSSLLEVLHLFTPLGMSVIMLCNILVSEFGAIVD